MAKARVQKKTRERPIRKTAASSITNKDQKLLWSRAAGRCSMPECKVELTLDTKKGASATLGAMSHIVGEAPNGPRGKSCLPLRDRNSYANLILLCSHHHDIIDEDEEEYPVEILHQIKTTHELWVRERLGDSDPDPDELVYANIIDSIVSLLQLDRWTWFIDNAVRDLVHTKFIDALSVLNSIRQGTVWPAKKPLLKKAIKELLGAYSDFIEHYETKVELRGGGDWLGPERQLNRKPGSPEYFKALDQEDRWSSENFWLLCNYAVKLNNFANAVRKFSNPMFYRLQGKFLVVDSLGVHFGGKYTIYSPTMNDIKAGIKKMKLKIKVF
mgnify:CR=1 FL=1